MKRKYIFIVVFVIAILGLIYYTINISRYTDNTVNTDKDNLNANNNSGEITKAVISSTIAPTDGQNSGNPSVTLVQRYLVLFIDKNNNGIKDADEVTCSQCTNQSLLVAMQNNPNQMPLLNKISSIGLGSGGTIGESKLTGNNACWGVFEGQNIIVPVSMFNFGDGVSDAQVPVILYSLKVAGVNVNIVETSNAGDETDYTFSKLIPVMQTASDQHNLIYVKFTSPSDTSKYYISKGTISTDGKTYDLKINWELNGDFSNELLNSANLTFYIL